MKFPTYLSLVVFWILLCGPLLTSHVRAYDVATTDLKTNNPERDSTPEHNPTDYNNPVQRGTRDGIPSFTVTVCDGHKVGPWFPFGKLNGGSPQTTRNSDTRTRTGPVKQGDAGADVVSNGNSDGGLSINSHVGGYTSDLTVQWGDHRVRIVVTVIDCSQPVAPGHTRGTPFHMPPAPNGHHVNVVPGTDAGNSDGTFLIGVVLPNDMRPGETCTGSTVSNPQKYVDVPALHTVETKIPTDDSSEVTLEGQVIDIPKNSNTVPQEPVAVKIPQEATTIPLLVTTNGGKTTLVHEEIPVTGEKKDKPTFTETVPTGDKPGDYQTPSLLVDTGTQVIRGHMTGDGKQTHITVDDQPAAVVAETPRAVYWQVPKGTTPGSHTIKLDDGPTHVSFPVSVAHITLSAEKLVLTKGDTTTFHVTLTGPESLPSSAWEHAAVPSDIADTAKLASSGVNIPDKSQPGSIVLQLTNESTDTVSVSSGDHIVLPLAKENFSGGPYKYDATITSKKSGPFKLKAQATFFTGASAGAAD